MPQNRAETPDRDIKTSFQRARQIANCLSILNLRYAIPKLHPLGLQNLYSGETFRPRLFALLEEHILHGIEKTAGRPGVEMWRILVMGVVKQGLGCNFGRLHEPVNERKTLRRFLGHWEVWDEHRYQSQTLVDHVSLLRPELLVAIYKIIVESGHAVARKEAWRALARAV